MRKTSHRYTGHTRPPARAGEPRWREVAEIAHEWYFGRNTQAAVLATGGACRDGIDPSTGSGQAGVNPNMGAESTICYLMSAIALANRPAAPLRVAR